MSGNADPVDTGNGRDDRRYTRCQRLLTAAQFAEVFAARRVVREAHFVLHYRRNGLANPRLGLVIPKKLARSAVLRNAIKRQAREVFRLRREELPAADLVIRLAQPLDRPRRPALAKNPDARQAWREEILSLLGALSGRVGQ